MSFVGFVPWAAAPEFIAGGTPAAVAVEGAGAAALDAALAMPALVLGAGFVGWQIGSYLKKTFLPDDPTGFPPPGAVFGGGKAGHMYRLTYTYATASGGPGGGTITVEGPVIGFIEGDAIVGTPQPAHYWWVFYGPTQQAYGPGLVDSDITQYPTITNLEPLTDPTEDTKGVPYAYAPSPPQPDKLKPTIPMPILPGSPGFPGIIVPFKRPKKDGDTEVTPPGEQDDPAVTVQIPGLGIQIDFGSDGIHWGDYNPLPVNLPSTQKDPRVPPPQRAADLCDCPCDLTDVEKKLDDIKTEEDEIKDYVKPKEYEEHTIVLGSGSGGVFNLPALTFGVGISLTSFPTNAKMQSGNGGPDVIYAGWHSFSTYASHQGVRNPIHYESQVYPVPLNATSFSYTLYNGFEGTVVAYYKQLKP